MAEKKITNNEEIKEEIVDVPEEKQVPETKPETKPEETKPAVAEQPEETKPRFKVIKKIGLGIAAVVGIGAVILGVKSGSYNKGYVDGNEDGYDEGYDKGYEHGLGDGKEASSESGSEEETQ